MKASQHGGSYRPVLSVLLVPELELFFNQQFQIQYQVGTGTEKTVPTSTNSTGTVFSVLVRTSIFTSPSFLRSSLVVISKIISSALQFTMMEIMPPVLEWIESHIF